MYVILSAKKKKKKKKKKNLRDFLDFFFLSETDPNSPLPPPKSAAKKLKEEATVAIQTWHDKFGAHYKKLALGYNYLKTCKKVNISMQFVRLFRKHT